jgi:Na+/H+ antiporter
VNLIEASIFILLFTILSVPIATRFRLPLEVFLVIGSCLISLIPGIPLLQLSPMIIFNLLLPPILFYAAYFTSWRDFKANLRPISLLAFGLVIFTTVSVAYVARYLLPGFTLTEGYLLGAIISPTDATSATTLIRKLGAPRRLIAVLEGESLVNDATALLLFRFSLVAIFLGSFSTTNAIMQFFILTLGGIVIGLLLGVISILLIKKIHDAQAETTFTFIMAFTCYIVAEHLGASGIIATVVCGMYTGIYFPQSVTSQSRVNAKASWSTAIFIINGFAFTLIGLQLPWILKNLGDYSLTSLIYYGATISFVVIILRIIWVYPVAHLSRIVFPFIAKKDPTPSWQALFILSWSGMRGIVSLAAVLSIPLTLPSGLPFPHRDLFLFITYCVIVSTLLIPTFTLPFLLRCFQLTDADQRMKEEAYARVKSLESSLEKITILGEKEHIAPDLLNEHKKAIERKLNVVKTQLESAPYSSLNQDYFEIKKLTIASIDSERETLFNLQKLSEISDDIFHILSDELDLEEMRAKSLRI